MRRRLRVVKSEKAADPASDTVSLGQDVEIAFNADVAGSWKISLNPTDFDAGGGTLASGTLTAGQAVSATVTVSDAWVEGVNQLRILVTDDDGLPGHDAILLSLDSQPSGVTLRSSQVDFGDGKLVLSFNGINAEDLDYYEIYVTTTPF